MPTFKLPVAPHKLSQVYAAENKALQILYLYAEMKSKTNTFSAGSIINDESGKSLEYCPLVKIEKYVEIWKKN